MPATHPAPDHDRDTDDLTAMLRRQAEAGVRLLGRVPGADLVTALPRRVLGSAETISPKARRVAVYAGTGALSIVGALEWPVALAISGAGWLTQGRRRAEPTDGTPATASIAAPTPTPPPAPKAAKPAPVTATTGLPKTAASKTAASKTTASKTTAPKAPASKTTVPRTTSKARTPTTRTGSSGTTTAAARTTPGAKGAGTRSAARKSGTGPTARS